ncbi:MAG: SsrA-binding protein SmpB [Dethiobacter sp.]|jgi:SsrA-binding protein|nr:SsrA-binding protein SmpB [Dethiobacter sp.]MBS3901251.1 SsrA-binding protein SmpB [Dethiobacter sp.]MBS3989076.1 SsrA-binding protein SmpB [Dethiobacter sp.]
MEEKVFAKNRKAFHDYHIEEKYEAGMVLTGTEVKSIRSGKANLKDSYARIENSEVFIHNMHVSPYEQGNRFNHEPLRKRKILMNRREISRLIGLTREKGYTLIPLKLYAKKGFIKVEIALARGKREYDKRDAIATKEAKREVERVFKERQYQ